MKKFLAILLVFLITLPQNLIAMNNQVMSTSSIEQHNVAMKKINWFIIGRLPHVLTNHKKQTLAVLFVGLFGAGFYPSMTNYQMRTRDSTRMLHINSISLAILSYQADYGEYPKPLASGCIPTEELKNYLKIIPTDPVAGRLAQGCTDKNAPSTYTYALTKNEKGEEIMLLGADMEVRTAGNSFLAIFAYVETPNLIKSWQERKIQWQHYIIVQ